MTRLIAERFDVYMTQLDPTVGVEMRKTRPCVIISPDHMHRHLLTVIIAPLTGTLTNFPTRVRSGFGGIPGEIALDQMRSVDVTRLGKRLGKLDSATAQRLLQGVKELFFK